MKASYNFFLECIREKGITTYRVSKETGVPQPRFSEWKLRGWVPGYKSMRKIAAYLSTEDHPLTASDFYDKDIQDEEGGAE